MIKLPWNNVNMKAGKVSLLWLRFSFSGISGVNIGHKLCSYLKPGLPVPAGMGWLWTAQDVPGMKVNHPKCDIYLNLYWQSVFNLYLLLASPWLAAWCDWR